MKRIDLHTHSNLSDGTCPPREVVRLASRADVTLLALTDHDTMDGVCEAQDAGEALGVVVLPSVELDCQWPEELHILGLDMDPEHPRLVQALELARSRRNKRNKIILERLQQMGCDIWDAMPPMGGKGSIGRLHMALALCQKGYAQDVREAFRCYLRQGAPGYYEERKFSPEEAIQTILDAGGIPVLAHPCHLRLDPHQTVKKLVDMGIKGLEAYYPSSTLGQQNLFTSLAEQYHLLVTCGSDFHGQNRVGVPLGCAWRDVPGLLQTEEHLLQHHAKYHRH